MSEKWKDSLEVKLENQVIKLKKIIKLGLKYFKKSKPFKVEEFTKSSKVNDTEGLYCFYFSPRLNGDELKSINEAFNKKKIDLKKIKNYLPSYNKDEKALSTRNLYIGISTSGKLRSRINEHFKKCAKSTYALKLSSWLPKEYKERIRIEYYYFDEEAFIRMTKEERIIFLREMERALHKDDSTGLPIVGKL